jgi:8-oxo-dGTP diphosphatase
MTNFVVGFAFSPNKEKVALIIKNRPSWQLGYLNGIGGKIEKGECPINGMVREFEEEACIKTNALDWTYFAYESGPYFKIYYYYTVFDDIEEFNAITCNTDEEILLVNTNELQCRKIVRGIDYYLPIALYGRNTQKRIWLPNG